MDKLPQAIWIYIYRFDPTYYEKFNKVTTELLSTTSMWKLYFYHNDLKYNFKTSNNLTYKQALDLSNYWNNQFLETHSYSTSYYRYYDKRNGFCEPRHISDCLPIKSYFSRLKANIESSKIVLSW